MTEAEWMACDDPARMLRWLTGTASHPPSPGVSSRRLRLFACACHEPDQYWRRWGEEGYKRGTPPLKAAQFSVGLTDEGEKLSPAEKARRAHLLRDVAGNPFRPVTLCGEPAAPYDDDSPCSACDRLRTPTVLSLAQAAYGGDWAALPVLADALEEAGCDCEEVLMHLRGWGRCPHCAGTGWVDVPAPLLLPGEPPSVQDCPVCEDETAGWYRLRGPHVRGCWAISLLLGQG